MHPDHVEVVFHLVEFVDIEVFLNLELNKDVLILMEHDPHSIKLSKWFIIVFLEVSIVNEVNDSS